MRRPGPALPSLPLLPLLVALLLAPGLAWTAPASAIELRVVALSGQDAPGTAPVLSFEGFGDVVMNDAGRTAFQARLSGPGIVVNGNDGSIWSEGAGPLVLLAREGDPAPGPPGSLFSNLNSPILNDVGEAIFGNAADIWAETGPVLGLVVQAGDPAPGTPPGVQFGGFFSIPILNDVGESAFLASLQGTGVSAANNRGIWSSAGGALGLVAREGDAAPVLPAGPLFGSPDRPDFNDLGQTVFLATLTGAPPGADQAVFSEGTGALAALAQRGGPAADAPPGVLYSNFREPAINDVGRAAFGADFTGAGVTGANNSGVYVERAGGLDLVAREGDAAPGAPAGVLFFDFDPPELNDAGQVTFAAKLTGAGVTPANNEAVFGPAPGGVTLYFREGEPAPGLPAGVEFREGGFPFDDPVINEIGGILVAADLQGPGVGVTNNEALFYAHDASNRVPVVREGDLIEVLPGDFRTVLAFSTVQGSSAQGRRALDARPRVAFIARFTDGSSAVLVATIPRPSCACAAGFPLVRPLLCYERPGPAIADFAFSPGHFLQAVGLGPVSYCRHNASFQWIDLPGLQACEAFLQCLCTSPGLGLEVCGNGLDDDCDGAIDANDPDCDVN